MLLRTYFVTFYKNTSFTSHLLFTTNIILSLFLDYLVWFLCLLLQQNILFPLIFLGNLNSIYRCLQSPSLSLHKYYTKINTPNYLHFLLIIITIILIIIIIIIIIIILCNQNYLSLTACSELVFQMFPVQKENCDQDITCN